MMREVLERRFKRLLKPPEGDAAQGKPEEKVAAKADDDSFPHGPIL